MYCVFLSFSINTHIFMTFYSDQRGTFIMTKNPIIVRVFFLIQYYLNILQWDECIKVLGQCKTKVLQFVQCCILRAYYLS